MSRLMLAVLVLTAAVGLAAKSQAPELRRYLNIKKM